MKLNWTKRTCNHKWEPYRYNTMEFHSGKNVKSYNREGAYILSHVFCAKCGEIREAINDGNTVRFKPIT